LIFEYEGVVLIDHPAPALRAAGVKCIEWNTTWKSASDFFQDLAKIKATGSVDAENFSKIKEAMEGPMGNVAEPKQPKQPPKELSEEQKRMKQEKAEKQKALAAAQQVVQKLTTSVAPTTLDPLMARLDARPWGSTMKPEILKLVGLVKDMVADLHKSWSDGSLEIKKDPSFDISPIVAKTQDAQEKYNELDQIYLGDLRALK